MAESSQARADVVLAEASLSHMAAAAALVRAGKRVTLLQGEAAGEVPPWALPPLGLLPPAGAGSLLEELFIASDMPPPLRRAFRTPPILFQIIWPGFRVDVASDPQIHRAGLAREFGEAEAERIEKFEKGIAEDAHVLSLGLASAPVFPPVGWRGWFQRKKLPPVIPARVQSRLSEPFSAALARANLGEPSRLFLKLCLKAAGLLFEDDPPLAAAALALSAERREHALLPPPNTPELRDLLAVQLIKRGVNLRNGNLMEFSRASEGLWQVETSTGEILKGRVLVEGESALQTELLRRGGKIGETRTLRIVMDPLVIPVGMCPRGVLIENPLDDLRDGNMILYNIEPPGSEEDRSYRLWATILAGEWAGAPIEDSAEALEKTSRRRGAPRVAASPPPEPVRARVLRHLGTVMPFASEYFRKSAWLPSTAGTRYLAATAATRHLSLAGTGLKLKGAGHYALGRFNLPPLAAWGELKAAFSLASLIKDRLEN